MVIKSGNQKKKPTAKALAHMEANLAQKSSSAKKVAARKCAASGKKNRHPVTATPVPVTSLAPSSSASPVILAPDNGTLTCYCYS